MLLLQLDILFGYHDTSLVKTTSNQYLNFGIISVSEKMRVLVGVLLNSLISGVFGHGYLAEPPARNAMWRYGTKN